jgi:hypothetical protein
LIVDALGEAVRREFEGIMEGQTYRYRSDFARKYFGQGRDEGRAEGKASMLLRLLHRRFRSVPEAVEQRVLQSEVACLDAWAERVLDATTMDEVFA